MTRRGLSKTKIVSSLQCQKRLWLEVHRPELIPEDPARERVFAFGHQVGEMARRLAPGGVLIEHQDRLADALKETRRRLAEGGNQVLFEAAIDHDGVLVRADILELRRGKASIREVKASGSLKDYHLSDAAIQTWVLGSAGLKVDEVSIQHIDTGFVYPGDGEYRGLFAEVPVMDRVKPLLKQVPDWVAEARRTLGGSEPSIGMGKQCSDPYPCPFVDYCESLAPKGDLPLTLLPNAGKTIPGLEAEGFRTLRDIPVGRLKSEMQERVRRAHVTGEQFFDPAVGKLMREFGYPRTFFDFETVGFAVPIWKGTRPYQQIPFQWSMHVEGPRAETTHHEFLDLSGELPAERLVEALLAAIPDDGPIFAYNASFEGRCLELLGELLPARQKALDRVRDRLVDLYPITRKNYYHPDMRGSWSLKAVMPTIPGGPDYAQLEDVQEGGAAQDAYFEAVSRETSPERRRTLESALLRYCKQDTEALIVLSRFLQSEPG
ncbi:MAG: DUF2779 domain-containing protein [Pseudomonadota bacterium]